MRAISRAFLYATLLVVALSFSLNSALAENKFGPDGLNYYSGTDAVEDQHIDLSLAGGATNLLNGPFVDPSAGLDDNCTQLIDLGFSFNFYGNLYTKAYVNLNGFLIFEPPTGASTPSNSDLTQNLAPTGAGGNGYVLWSTDLPNAIVAPFLANLDFSVGSGTLLYQTVGSGNKKIFVVQWKNVPLKGSPSETVSVQIQLHANGFIYFVYDKVPDTLTDSTAGSRWTGVEDETGNNGLTYTSTQFSNPNLRVPYQLSTGTNILIYSDQDTAKLTVVSAFGNPSPPVGDQVPRPKNSLVTALVEPTVEINEGERYRCTGWVGTGSAPSSWDGTGAPNYTVFEIVDDSSITWQWVQDVPHPGHFSRRQR
ncbi:MAG: hypothetical protein U5N86_04370 [Planctomycetota bacterium]|nr:hypothetical protein [Planctomycetota bacterium]